MISSRRSFSLYSLYITSRWLLLLVILATWAHCSQQLHSSAMRSQEARLRRQIESPLASPLIFRQPNNNKQQQHPDAPKLIPLSALDRYAEGSDLKLFCSASAPTSAGRLQFEWTKNQLEQLTGAGNQRVHISMMDDSASVLRINQLEADDNGNYTCLVRNQHGFDSSTVRVNVKVRVKWIREPPSEVQILAGRSLQVECDASSQPAPTISWTSLKDRSSVGGKYLRFERIHVNDSGLYECKVIGRDHLDRQSLSSGGTDNTDQLHKLTRIIVNGEYHCWPCIWQTLV